MKEGGHFWLPFVFCLVSTVNCEFNFGFRISDLLTTIYYFINFIKTEFFETLDLQAASTLYYSTCYHHDRHYWIHGDRTLHFHRGLIHDNNYGHHDRLFRSETTQRRRQIVYHVPSRRELGILCLCYYTNHAVCHQR